MAPLPPRERLGDSKWDHAQTVCVCEREHNGKVRAGRCVRRKPLSGALGWFLCVWNIPELLRFIVLKLSDVIKQWTSHL